MSDADTADTVMSRRRDAADTVVSGRRGSERVDSADTLRLAALAERGPVLGSDEAETDATALSSRRRGAAPAEGAAPDTAPPADAAADDTAPPADAAADDTAPPADGAADDTAERVAADRREAYQPDAAALRAATPVRPAQPVVVSHRTPPAVSTRRPVHDRVDREHVDRASRAFARRRAIGLLIACAAAAAAAAALLILLPW